MSIVKEEAKKLIDKLPDQATWDDIIYEFYVKKKLAAALKSADEAGELPHVSPFVCYASACRRIRHQNGAGITRA